MTNFILKGVLPSIKSRSRNNKIAVAIWIIGAVDWALYTAFNVHFTNKK